MRNSVSMKKLGIKGRLNKRSCVNISTGKMLTSTVFEIQLFGVTSDS